MHIKYIITGLQKFNETKFDPYKEQLCNYSSKIHKMFSHQKTKTLKKTEIE